MTSTSLAAPGPTAFAPSFGQQRLWFLDRLQPDSSVYNVPMVMRLTGRVDLELLRASLRTVLRRHDALRTVLVERDGELLQVVSPSAEPTIRVLEADGSPTERETAARAQIEAEARRPFDLATGPLVRTLLIRLASDEHYLMFTLHHCVSDGWSLAVLLAELGTAYAAHAAGAEPDLPHLSMQYPEFAAWQREQVAGPFGEEALDYWVDQLRGAPMLLAMPTDRERPVRQSHEGGVHFFELPAELADRLRAHQPVRSSTLFMVLLAGYAAVLARYSGQPEVVVGTAVGGRSRPETEALIGFFVNSLPLRVSLTGDPTFRELVGRVRDVTLDGLDYADLPFEEVVRTVQPQRDLGYAPVYQAELTLRSTPPLRLDLPGIAVSQPELVYSDTAKVDLALGFADEDGRLTAAFEYNSDLFEPATVERFADSLIMFLTAAAADPDVRVSEVSLLSAAERTRILVDWNDTTTEAAPPASALELIAATVARRPNAVAVVDPAESLTYRELDRRANQLAQLLRATGVGPDAPVALCLERGAAMVVAVLAVWKAGGAYLPLDPSWPAKRLRLMLTDSGTDIAVVDERSAGRLSEVLAGVGHVLDVRSAADQPDEPPASDLCGADLAYLLYTSGSTGTPKGVEVLHGAVANLLVDFGARLGLGDQDAWAAVTTLSFDISVVELLLPLTVGARVVVLDGAEVADPALLLARLTDSGVTALQSTPSRWRMLLGHGPIPPAVRTRLSGGEPLTRELADALMTDGATLWNGYGPTEATVYSSVVAVRPAPAPVAVGLNLSNVRGYLLDGAMRPVPIGVAGEIHLGGLALARGYRNRPDLSAQRFVPDPFGEPGERLYATGDLARYRADGTLDFVGRADHQVKVRGFRIELGEIEAALAEHPLIGSAVVLAWNLGTDDTRLVAYAVPADPADTDPGALWSAVRPQLAESLPEYMLPATLVVLTELPMTASGKTDRAALRQPDWENLHTHQHVAPATPLQRVLAGLWCAVLGRQDIGLHDDFFAVGGHSMLAAKLLVRVREVFAVDLPMVTLFDHRTVAGFADALLRAERTPGQVDAIAGTHPLAASTGEQR